MNGIMLGKEEVAAFDVYCQIKRTVSVENKSKGLWTSRQRVEAPPGEYFNIARNLLS